VNAAAYYADLTRQYGRYAGRARGWHYGVWEPDVRSHQQALLRSNERLVRGLDLGRDSHVLDVGCGIGGLAVWLARRFGCHVTGITVCRPHVAEAAAVAREAGVADRCEFLEMDMDGLDLPSRRFDLVVNQDTLCHAADKQNFLASVGRLVQPAGWWRAIDFSVQDAPLTGAEQADYDAVCQGFHIPSLASPASVRAILASADFTDVQVDDLTAAVAPTARHILRRCYAPRLLEAVGLDWIIFSRDQAKLANRRGHVRAAMAYSRGLLRGHLKHIYYSARPSTAARSRS
jgi:cyclopropane fatty-acyl-phospholipid synthase-like methyltransferase